jgi:hypothetical protein
LLFLTEVEELDLSPMPSWDAFIADSMLLR